MENKLFLTGLALGIENEVCPCTNYNIDWIFKFPSTLLWVKKIIITESIWDIIINQHYSPTQSEEQHKIISESIKLIFEILYSEGIIEIVSIKGLITKEFSDNIYNSIENDLNFFANKYPKSFSFESDKKYFSLNKQMYCVPSLWTIYAGLVLSRFFNANGLFSEYELNFYDYKYRIGANRIDELKGKYHAFQKVIELNLPNLPIGHEYLFENKENCLKCPKEISCKDSYLLEIEKNTKNIIEKRNYDEIQQIILLQDRILKKRDSNEFAINPIEFANEFSSEKSKINKRLKLIFPKIKRWSHLTTFVSIPVALSGLVFGNPYLSIPAGLISGIAKGSEELLKYYESKYNWINFLNK